MLKQRDSRSKRGFRQARQAIDRARYPDLEASNGGRWIRCIAGAMTGAALMAFVVSCNQVDGERIGPPAVYDLAVDAAVDFDLTPDSEAPDSGAGDLDLDSGTAVDADSSPGDLGE
jgi:hypothetical protein